MEKKKTCDWASMRIDGDLSGSGHDRRQLATGPLRLLGRLAGQFGLRGEVAGVGPLAVGHVVDDEGDEGGDGQELHRARASWTPG